MVTGLDDVVQHDDLVGVAHGGQPVDEGDPGPALGQGAESLLRGALGLGVRVRPRRPDGVSLPGLVCEAMGREEDAAAEYSRAIQLEPGFSDALYSLRSEIPRNAALTRTTVVVGGA